jgi:bifunctional UDP-N-acetylglucosamine pyrophosphorylase/glucosamine-1-phosphate N-acetyltransferase
MVTKGELERSASANLAVLVGDAPLLSSDTLRDLIETHRKRRAAVTILTMRLERPQGYGRIVRRRDGRVRRIVEEKIASPAERRIREVSSGILCFSRRALLAHLERLTADNVQKEYLLTDLVEILARQRQRVEAMPLGDPREVLGVNDRVELAHVEGILHRRKAETLMRDGVTIIDPHTTYIDDAVSVGRDTVIEPGVSLLGETRVGRDCLIRPHCTIDDSTLGDRVLLRPCCVILESSVGSDVFLGPFANVRNGSVLEAESRIGNFVEVKNSRLGRGSKAQHLTYLGDAQVGEKVNVGAGTVTCNYDGERKHPTRIEDGAFIGSGSMLVAPVRVGRGAYVAAGSTITEDVPAGSLALGRARQVNKEGWVKAKDAARTAGADGRPSGMAPKAERA